MKTKMKNRWISLLLCLVMVLGLLPMPAMAAEVVASGTSGSASWTLEDGVFTISGGAMANYASAEERPWHAYAAQIQKVVIGGGVLRLGDYAFADCPNLTEVEIGSSVDTIGAYSFENTTSLTEVVMPKNVKVFCDGMFHNSGLKKLYVYARKTEFDGFDYTYWEEDDVLPLDTVVYCYGHSHAYYHFLRDTVILTDDMVMDIDNGNSTVALDPNDELNVRDLWAAADTADGLVFDYTVSMKTSDILRVHNEMVEEYQKIGTDYYNNGKLFLNAYIQLETDSGWIDLPRASAMYSIFEYNLLGEPNNCPGYWDDGEVDFITVTGDETGVTVHLNATMQELEAYAGMPVNQISIYIGVDGESYRYNYYYDREETNHEETVEAIGMSLYDARMRESGAEIYAQMTLDRKFTVEDFPWWEGEPGFYKPVSRHYVWGYSFARMRYEYDEEGNWICIGGCFEELEGDGIVTEDHNGILYGGVRGTYDAGSNASVSIRDMLSPEELAFVETLKGVDPMGNGGEARIELNYTLYLTFADGSTKVLGGMYADEITSIAGVCLHTCTVCGMCTSEELLSCNSQYGWRTNECFCEDPSPAIEYSSVDNAEVVNSNVWCGEVTVRVETFDVAAAVTTDYFKAIINSVGSSNVAAVYDITLYDEYGEAYTINEWGGTEEYVTVCIPVSAEIAQAAAGGELELYHVDKNGIAEVVAVTADTVNNLLTFTGTSFSPYVLVEVVPYYGRTLLATMPNATALLYAYDQIVAGVEVSAESIEVYNGVDAISQDELAMVMDVYRRDYAHHFWVGNGYSISYNATTCVNITMQYILSGAELETAKVAFEEKVDEILAGLTLGMTEFERELYLHDKLAAMITYVSGPNAHNAYGAIVEGKAVCEGYAEALQYLLQRAGIQSFLAIGDSFDPSTGTLVGHEWNYVRIDGRYYHVDLTWNDQGENLFHAYFNQTDAVIQEDHVIRDTAYTRPVCNSVDAMFFTGKDTYLDSYTVESMGQLLKDNGMLVQVYIPGSLNDFVSWYYDNILPIAMNSGVSGGFSYGYTQLGRELILYLTVSCDHETQTFHPGVDATCTEDGYAGHYVCACGKRFADDAATVEINDLAAWQAGHGKIAALGHDLGDWYTVAAPDCEATGLNQRDCSRCDHTETREVEATGHSYEGVVTDPTCTEQGFTTYTCSVCADSYVADYTDALGHNYEEIVTEPTCEESGYTTHTCSACGDSYADTYVDAIGHNYVDDVCTNCGEMDPEAVIYGDVNGDGKIDGRDLLKLKRYLANYDDETETSTEEICAGADVNGDGKVDGRDLLKLKRYLANYDDETGTSTEPLGPAVKP